MIIDYTQTIKVVPRKEKFDEAFMKEFRETFYDFFTIEDHCQHVGWMLATRRIKQFFEGYQDTQFVEGYGPIGDYFVFAGVVSEDFEIY